MTEYLVDTAVFAYALGGPHPQRADCRALVHLAAAGEVRLHASVELVQELLHHRMRSTDRATAVQQARDVAELCTVHPFGHEVLRRALHLLSTTTLRGRDAVHAATGVEHGLATIISPDSDFDGVPGLARIEPAALS